MHSEIAALINSNLQELPDSFICPDINWAGLQIKGEDAQDFLQGQMTADVNAASCVLAGLCDLKGRLIASGYCLRINAEEFIYCVHASLIETIQQHWKLYAQFSKVNIEPSDKIVCMQRAIKNNALSYARPDYSEQNIALYTKPELIKHLQSNINNIVNGNCWLSNEIKQKLAHVTIKTTAKFLPQMLAFDQRGGISFSKGCYLGQEVVARTQHLGKVKRHLQLIHLTTTLKNISGYELINQQAKTAAIIINAAENNKTTIVLAVVHEQYKNDKLELKP